MDRREFLAALPACAVASQLLAAEAKIVVGPNDWPWWRGPTRDGVAAPQKVPLEWSADKNVLWEAPVPGRGHGSATVVGDRVFLATADEKTEVQGVLCLDRKTGAQKWHAEVHRGNFTKAGMNAKASHASATPACDGERVYINFLNNGAVHATALDLDGKPVWQQKVTDYTLHQGFGPSPAIYGPLLIVMADNKGDHGLLAGLDRATGKPVWTRKRPKAPNYASPIVLTVNGKDQLIQIGCDLITSLDPLTGKEFWELKGATTECVTSTVTDGTHVFTSGGYPRNHVAAVRADGSGIACDNKTRVYVPSMLIRSGYLYAVMDEGNAVCWKADTGAEQWKGRLGGTFSGSPVLVGEHVIATNEAARTFVFKASPKEFELVGENQLGSESFSTPTVCGGRIYLRAAVKDKGGRQEKLFCIGEK
ncbi:MAG: PQQ-binding-like beta-propeller repeat protein [Planctomycetes bacterium]|nr:PQQ-binding-like beta-propeller repeat protein [Planctomycetota bacterium]